MSAGGRWFVVTLLLLLHFALHPLWGRWPVGPDLAAGGLLLGSLLLPWGRAAALGCLIGILEASISLGPLGRTMLLFSLAGGLGGWVRHLVYSDSGRFKVTFVFFGVWVLRATVTLWVGGGTPVGALLVDATGTAALTTVICWLSERLVSAAGA